MQGELSTDALASRGITVPRLSVALMLLPRLPDTVQALRPAAYPGTPPSASAVFLQGKRDLVVSRTLLASNKELIAARDSALWASSELDYSQLRYSSCSRALFTVRRGMQSDVLEARCSPLQKRMSLWWGHDSKS